MAEAKPSSRLARLLREPLIHFLAIGLAIFALNAVINGRDETPEDVIIISQGRIAQIEESFRAVANRPPNAAELKDMVDDFVMEEIAYREAIAMGLDADDTVVRRRMRQKLEFLLDDVASIAEPTEAELQAWFSNHAADYARPEKRALRHVLASRDKRGEAAPADAVRFMQRLNAGADPASLGDASMLPDSAPLTTKAGVSALFGADFADAVFASGAKGWFGPVSSVFGEHVVKITDRASLEAASLDDVRGQVRNDLIAARRSDIRRKDEKRLLERYQVRIDWPEGKAPREAKP
jgi:hypothetical protein